MVNIYLRHHIFSNCTINGSFLNLLLLKGLNKIKLIDFLKNKKTQIWFNFFKNSHFFPDNNLVNDLIMFPDKKKCAVQNFYCPPHYYLSSLHRLKSWGLCKLLGQVFTHSSCNCMRASRHEGMCKISLNKGHTINWYEADPPYFSKFKW